MSSKVPQVVSGHEQGQITEGELPQLHDPMRWARALLPDTPDRDHDNSNTNPHDILLVFHARLISTLLEWRKSLAEIARQDYTRRPGTTPLAAMSYSHKRLASRTNASLDWWQDDLKSYRLDDIWTRQIQIDFLNAKVLVNSMASKNIGGGPEEDRLKEANRAFGVDAAYQLLRRCIAWSPPESIINLPQVYLKVGTEFLAHNWNRAKLDSFADDRYGRERGCRSFD